VSASTTLLRHARSYPLNPLASADLKLVEPLITVVSSLWKSSNCDELGEIYRSFSELFEKAKKAVGAFNHASPGMNLDRGISKTQYGARESVEDFLRRMEYISSGYDVPADGLTEDGSVLESDFQPASFLEDLVWEGHCS
jgi:hypothetical protein